MECNLLEPTDLDNTFLNNLMSELSLKFVNTGPSHHTTSNTWIDSIFVDACDIITTYDRFLPTFGRHDIITATIDIFHPSEIINSYTYKFINKITPDDVTSYLNGQDW